jgi:hypothetical protein
VPNGHAPREQSTPHRTPDPPPDAQLSIGSPGLLTRAAAAVIDSAVPSVLARPLRRALAVDVSDAVVRRGDDVAAAAHRLGARGYTHGGVVHVPDSLGTLDSAEATPLLAHELTHVAQQRRFGAALPAPGTAAGHRLEAEAVVVEQWFAGGAVGAPPDVRGHLPPGSPRSRHRNPGVQLAEAEAAEELPRIDVGWAVREFEKANPDVGSVRDLPEVNRVPDVSTAGLLAMYEQMQAADDNDDDDDEPPSHVDRKEKKDSGDPATGLTIGEITDLLADDPPRRWMDLDDTDDFEELSDRLYNQLVTRLRFDVLVERERSGTLLDFG